MTFRTEELCAALGVDYWIVRRFRAAGLITDTAFGRGSRCLYRAEDVRRVALIRRMPDYEPSVASGGRRGGRRPDHHRCAVILNCATNHSWRGWAVVTPDGEVSWASTAEAAVALKAPSGVTTIIPLAAIAAEADQAMREAA